jgi:hypothetical protein
MLRKSNSEKNININFGEMYFKNVTWFELIQGGTLTFFFFFGIGTAGYLCILGNCTTH